MLDGIADRLTSLLVVQLLLVVCAGSMTASMPFVAALYAAVLTAWSAAVVRLDVLHVCQFSRKGDTAPPATLA